MIRDSHFDMVLKENILKEKNFKLFNYLVISNLL